MFYLPFHSRISPKASQYPCLDPLNITQWVTALEVNSSTQVPDTLKLNISTKEVKHNGDCHVAKENHDPASKFSTPQV